MLSKSLVVNCALLKIHNEGPCLCKSCSAQARDLFGTHGSRFSGFAAIYPCLEWAMIAWAQNTKLGQLWTALDSTLRMIRDYQAIKRLAMDHLGVSAKAATCDAVSSPTRNAPVKQPNCNPALFSHHFGRSSESPRFNNGTASANEDVCKNGCVSKEQQVCFFFAGRKQNLLGTTALKTAWMLDIFATWIYSNSP